jgi:fumarylacetoacetase
VAIGDRVLDVAAAARSGLLEGEGARAGARAAAPSLNGIMSLGPPQWGALRGELSRLLRADTPQGARGQRLRAALLHHQRDVELTVPADVGDYTDFYASLHHAHNVGSMLRPQNPLFPNYKWMPIGYHGRASSLVASGTSIRRPHGQVSPDGASTPVFGPTARLDYEAEVGFYIGQGNELGEPIPLARCEAHLFGACLVNDWSARDVQAWEYQPLGPFLAKSFATSVSPWVVTLEALEPFRVPVAPRADGDPAPLSYLRSEEADAREAISITIEVALRSSRMRESGLPALRLSRGNLATMYWTPAQLVAHHTSNGCKLRAGDLIASGTISGPTRDERGCLLELTWRGTEPLTLPSGEQRRFLEDGDEVTLHGWCEDGDGLRIGFGECTGLVLPAR